MILVIPTYGKQDNSDQAELSCTTMLYVLHCGIEDCHLDCGQENWLDRLRVPWYLSSRSGREDIRSIPCRAVPSLIIAFTSSAFPTQPRCSRVAHQSQVQLTPVNGVQEDG
jgi:hypothetical protein